MDDLDALLSDIAGDLQDMDAAVKPAGNDSDSLEAMLKELKTSEPPATTKAKAPPPASAPPPAAAPTPAPAPAPAPTPAPAPARTTPAPAPAPAPAAAAAPSPAANVDDAMLEELLQDLGDVTESAPPAAKPAPAPAAAKPAPAAAPAPAPAVAPARTPAPAAAPPPAAAPARPPPSSAPPPAAAPAAHTPLIAGQVPCGKCSKVLTGSYVEAMDKQFCIDCFTCAVCGVQLGTQPFHCADGKAYCVEDYKNKFAKRCAACEQGISGQYLKALEQNYHPDCFVCAVCRAPFENNQFIPHEGQLLCPSDFARLTGTLCFGCGKIIEADYLNVLNQKYHVACLVCCTCAAPFPDLSFYEKQGKPQCEACFSTGR